VFVLINMAMTADGKIATADRRLHSCGSRRDQEHLLELRATADAVMCGAGTVNEEPVQLGPGPERFRRLRRHRGLAEHNLRVVVSGRGSLSPEAEVFRHRHSPIVVLASEAIPGARLRALRAVADEVLIRGRQTVDWGAAFEDLEKRWGVRRLLAEGGARLNAALWAAGLVDELHLTICPRLFGGRASPTIADGPGASRLADAAQMELRSCCRVGDELFVVYGATGR